MKVVIWFGNNWINIENGGILKGYKLYEVDFVYIKLSEIVLKRENV